jgi:hypothetical protein
MAACGFSTAGENYNKFFWWKRRGMLNNRYMSDKLQFVGQSVYPGRVDDLVANL